MHFTLAWRNIWRNPRRTFVITIAIVIGTWSMIMGSGFVRGMVEQMVTNAIATLTGHIQVHAQGFRSDPAVHCSMPQEEVTRLMKAFLPAESCWAKRARVNAVASNARHSRGVTLVGIDPAAEAEVSFIGKAVTQGRYLESEDPYGILIGNALMNTLETRLGHKLVLMSEDTNNDVASRAFRIVGVFQAGLEATERQYVFVTLPAAQEMLHLDDRLSEVAIMLADPGMVDETASALARKLPASYEVATWQKLLPIMTAYLKLMDSWIFIWYLVIFIAMGFGIVNTMLMAVFERIREFGLLKALGMKPWWIVRGVLTESVLLLILGSAVGNVAGLLTTMILSTTGIDLSGLAAGAEYAGLPRIIYPSVRWPDIVLANVLILILGLGISLYPAARAARSKPVEALAHT
ncbi:MAG TPA: ABC transporter permease [Thermodesulfobacteriota bacterium]|nr:ABC transporter permease [Thermodesulfobacteriota bacterium]